jgi:S-layer homology domain
MNQPNPRSNYQNIFLFGTFLSTAMLASNAAFAINLPASPAKDQAAVLEAAPSSTLDQVVANTAEPSLPAVADQQIAQASDAAGNWAEPFIQVLVEKGIIAGYPDGTFRPDQPVTRAEFAALIRKAFPDAPEVSSKKTFRDVPAGYWAADAIAKASTIGFMAGDPGGTFRPSDNIKRIESLVSLVNGTKLEANGTAANIDELFADTPQVPVFGRNALVAAAQRCVAVSVSYPDGRNFNPTGEATRADVAAFLHQTLVAAGKLTALAADSPAQKYIVNCAAAPSLAKITAQDVQSRIGIGPLPDVAAVAVRKAPNAPVGGVTTPNAFGANWGTVFVGAGYQDTLSPVSLLGGGPNTAAFGLGAGFGIGNSRDLIGLETSYVTSSNGGGPGGGASGLGLFDRGAVNFKLHKQVSDNFSIAAGWENAITNGYAPGDVTERDTFYGVLTGVLPVSDTNNFTASVGLGNGRFRQIADIFAGRDATSIFGSLGFRVSENIGLVADYNGRNFSVGLPLSLKLSDNVGLQVTPIILDVAGDKVAGEETRFGVGGGLGVRF